MKNQRRRAGALRDRLHFQSRGTVDDGIGASVPGGLFVTQFTAAGNLTPRTGGEEITAARLSGRQPYVLTVRNSVAMRSISAAWQIVDARNANRLFAVVSPPADPDGKNAWLEMLVVEGGFS